MENITLQEIWKQNEAFLDKTRLLNIHLLKQVKTAKVKSSIRSLLFLPISSIIFYVLVASYAVYFMIVNSESAYLMVSGAIIAFFSVLLIISSIKQLKQMLSIDFSKPITEMQTKISQMKLSIVTNFKIAAWFLPFAPFSGLFFFKALLNLDLTPIINNHVMIALGIITVLLEIASILILRALRAQNIDKKWMNCLLKSSGSQLDDALNFLNEIKEFEKEDEDV